MKGQRPSVDSYDKDDIAGLECFMLPRITLYCTLDGTHRGLGLLGRTRNLVQAGRFDGSGWMIEEVWIRSLCLGLIAKSTTIQNGLRRTMWH